MLYTLVEDSLKKIDGSDRFKLVHEVAQLARTAPIDASGKPVIWALQTISKDQPETNDALEIE